jgi:hypothetical protein
MTGDSHCAFPRSTLPNDAKGTHISSWRRSLNLKAHAIIVSLAESSLGFEALFPIDENLNEMQVHF